MLSKSSATELHLRPNVCYQKGVGVGLFQEECYLLTAEDSLRVASSLFSFLLRPARVLFLVFYI